eukprot:CAMPEP_0201588632 /NCGR_PEP_ID=MMETSP0190_2-20130828/157317_1 /ASSEMBLY_ACC=CAM_ASM_000263 /TAXON_ID=37353 /ORGANISM="Rosalina sp." /LENGTH=476 /DNA_ID=CAMNT_0048041163 /DNA_START=28 /DNA_END=1455 /DNA_ORIENTATION=+
MNIQASLKRKKSMKFQTDLVDYKILVIGLEGSGKSSIVNMIVKREKLHDPTATMGVITTPFETGSVNTKTIVFYEVGGNKHNRGLMQFYYPGCHGVIYVIDSSKHDQLIKPYKENKQEKYEYTNHQNGNLSPIAINDNPSQNNIDLNSSTDSSPELSPSPQPTPFSPGDTAFDDDSKTDDEYQVHDQMHPMRMERDTNTNTKSKSRSSSSTKLKKPKKLKISSLITRFEKLDETVANDKKEEDVHLNKENPMNIVMEKAQSHNRTNSAKLNKLLGISEDCERTPPSSIMPTFGRSKSAVTPSTFRSASSAPPPSTPPTDNTTNKSFSTPSSARNSFVHKFKRKRAKSSKFKGHKPQSSIGSITLTDEHMKFLPKLSPRMSTTISLKTGNHKLQPLTMNEAKCESAQELISKLNYELKNSDIPFVIYYNKSDEKESLSTDEITKQIEYQRIIDPDREYSIFECDSRNKEQVLRGFNW